VEQKWELVSISRRRGHRNLNSKKEGRAIGWHAKEANSTKAVNRQGNEIVGVAGGWANAGTTKDAEARDRVERLEML
jgi:hypothetical protein